MQNCNFPWLLYDCFIDWIEIILSLRLVFLKYIQIFTFMNLVDIWKKLIYCLLIFSLSGFFYWDFPRCWTFVVLWVFFHFYPHFVVCFFYLCILCHEISLYFIRVRFFTVPVRQPCIVQQNESTWFDWQTAVVWQSSGLSTASQW